MLGTGWAKYPCSRCRCIRPHHKGRLGKLGGSTRAHSHLSELLFLLVFFMFLYLYVFFCILFMTLCFIMFISLNTFVHKPILILQGRISTQTKGKSQKVIDIYIYIYIYRQICIHNPGTLTCANPRCVKWPCRRLRR